MPDKRFPEKLNRMQSKLQTQNSQNVTEPSDFKVRISEENHSNFLQGDEAAPNQYFQLKKRLYESIEDQKAKAAADEAEVPLGNEEPQVISID